MYYIIFASLIASLDIIDISLFTLILPTLQEVINVSINDILWIQYSYLISSSIITAILPIISKYCSIQKLIITGCLLYLCGSLIQIYLLQDFWILLFSRSLQGLCIGVLNPGSLIILNTNFRDRAFIKATSNYGLIIMLINALIPVFYGAIIYYYSWQDTFIYSVIYCSILILFSIILHIKSSKHVDNINDQSEIGLLKIPRFFTYLLMACMYYGISISVQTFISIIMQKQQAYEAEHVSFLISLKGVGSCFGFIIVPQLLQYFRSLSLSILCIIITIFSYSILYRNQIYIIYEISFLLQGCMLSIFNIISTRNAFRNIPESLNITASSFYILGRFIASLISIELVQNSLQY